MINITKIYHHGYVFAIVKTMNLPHSRVSKCVLYSYLDLRGVTRGNYYVDVIETLLRAKLT